MLKAAPPPGRRGASARGARLRTLALALDWGAKSEEELLWPAASRLRPRIAQLPLVSPRASLSGLRGLYIFGFAVSKIGDDDDDDELGQLFLFCLGISQHFVVVLFCFVLFLKIWNRIR